jgi:hypothetical protein
MIKVDYTKIVKEDLIYGAQINNEFIGFKEDYLVIHCLISEWRPKSIFEIGTCTGMGCLVMKTSSPESKITTLDINQCGHLCPGDTEKIVGNSMTYDFSKHYPIDCWFIDGDHVYDNVYKETKEALKSEPRYIIYHDSDIPDVYDAIIDSFKDHGLNYYDLYQVVNPPFVYSSSGKQITRVAYAVKKDLVIQK